MVTLLRGTTGFHDRPENPIGARSFIIVGLDGATGISPVEIEERTSEAITTMDDGVLPTSIIRAWTGTEVKTIRAHNIRTGAVLKRAIVCKTYPSKGSSRRLTIGYRILSDK
jgi:hypothetical protein